MGKKIPVGIRIMAFFGFILAIAIIAVTFIGPPLATPKFVQYSFGFSIIFLSLGLHLLWNWIRVVLIVLSSLFICFYLLLTIATGGINFFAMILFPILLFCVSSIVYLSSAETRKQFK